MKLFHRKHVLPLSLCLIITLLGGFFISHSSSVPASAVIENRKLPIYCVSTEKPQVSISFDAAWGNDDTEELLSILAQYQVKTTFFMTGGWVSTYPDDVKAIAAAGHDLGNHSENHKQMSQLSAEECQKEIQSVHDRVKELTGQEMCLFRPPYGDYNDTLIEAAEALITIQFSGIVTVSTGRITEPMPLSPVFWTVNILGTVPSSSCTTVPNIQKMPCRVSSKDFMQKAMKSFLFLS